VRSMLGHSGVCDKCGKFGYVWVDRAVTLDLGPGATPIETAMTGDQLCDTCEHERHVRESYAYDPILAQQIYCIAPCDVECYLARERAKQEQFERDESASN
jgi:hypothetical protein